MKITKTHDKAQTLRDVLEYIVREIRVTGGPTSDYALQFMGELEKVVHMVVDGKGTSKFGVFVEGPNSVATGTIKKEDENVVIDMKELGTFTFSPWELEDWWTAEEKEEDCISSLELDHELLKSIEDQLNEKTHYTSDDIVMIKHYLKKVSKDDPEALEEIENLSDRGLALAYKQVQLRKQLESEILS